MATDYKPMAYKSISNVFSMTIELNSTGEQVRYRMEDITEPVDNKPVSKWLKVYYTRRDGHAYFMAFGRRHHLDEFMQL